MVLQQYHLDILRVQQEQASNEIKARKDKEVIDYLWCLITTNNLAKALSDIPNTPFKKAKYYVNRLLGRIK